MLTADKIDGKPAFFLVFMLHTSDWPEMILDMTRFYFLLSRVADGLNKSAKTFETHLAAVGGEIVKEQAAKTSPQQCIAAAIPFIKKLMELYQKRVLRDLSSALPNTPTYLLIDTLVLLTSAFRRTLYSKNR